MYRLEVFDLDWRAKGVAGRKALGNISPTVWGLGATSLLTDISSQIVESVLPAYLVLTLHLNPIQFGLIDGVYQGFALVMFGLAAGVAADRTWRHKLIAQLGYALSTVSRILLLAAGAVWSGILVAIAVDRLGKSARVTPRDTLIGLHSTATNHALAFGVHRAMDACGAFIGPLVAFTILLWLPGRYDLLWVVSLVFGALGVLAISLFVRQPERISVTQRGLRQAIAGVLARPAFARILALGVICSLATVSDGFIYLMAHEKTHLASTFIPLFFVGTAAFFMLFAIPIGAAADRFGRLAVLAGGYSLLALLYLVLLSITEASVGMLIVILGVLGLHFAATEGVLLAIASSVIGEESRGIGIALLAAGVGLGKLFSSIGFGTLWYFFDQRTALVVFSVVLVVAMTFMLSKVRKYV